MPITIKLPRTLSSYVNSQFTKPELCLVTIIDDKHVSWKFCMHILTKVFHKSQEDAQMIAEDILTDGEGFCGGYMPEIAETKAGLIEELAKKEGFSLTCLVEEV